MEVLGEICCRVCGNSDGTRYQANGFKWFRCERCTTLQKVLTYEQYSDLNPTYDPGEYFDTVSREQIERYLDVDACAKLIEHTRRNYLPSRGSLSITLHCL
jgi:hypothetical protein